MALNIFPEVFSVAFSPQHHSEQPQTHKAIRNSPQADPSKLVTSDQAKLGRVKTISNDNNISTANNDLASTEKEIRIRIDPESKKVIIEVVDKKTGEEVRQIPGEEFLKLTQRIADFHQTHLDEIV